VEIIYSPGAKIDIQFWKNSGNEKIMNRITLLIESIEKTPFSGIGKPEPLKHEMSGFWSRRITKEHRLVYRKIDETIEITALRFHY